MLCNQHVLSFAFTFMVFNTKFIHSTALLYPRESETREIKSLDGIWNFVYQTNSTETRPDEGMLNKWYLNDLSKVYAFTYLFNFVKISKNSGW